MTTIQLTPTPRRAYGCTAMSEYLPCPRCSVRTNGAGEGLRATAERRVIGCDERLARPAQTAELIERDEDELAASLVVALAEQRDARNEVERLRAARDVIVRGTDGGRPAQKVTMLSRMLNRRHCPPQSKRSSPLPGCV